MMSPQQAPDRLVHRHVSFVVGLAYVFITAACPGGDALVCGTDTQLEDGSCVSTRVETQCGEGTVFNSATGECRAAVNCAPGTTYDAAARVCVANAVCGVGTELNEENGECVPTIACGPGTVPDEVTGNCVSITQCGAGTTFEEAAGECIPLDTCGEGTTFHPLTHLCTPDVACGPGLVTVDGTCLSETQIFAMDADAAEALADDNDPAYGGVPEALTLEPVGDAVIAAGTIGRPVDRDDDEVPDQDRDVWAFTGMQGQLLRIRVVSDGLPQPAFTVQGPAGYARSSRRGVVLAPVREVLLPRGGEYTVSVEPAGASPDAAPIGDPDFGYLLVIEELAFPEPALIDTSVAGSVTGQLFDLTNNIFRFSAEEARAVQWSLSVATPAGDAVGTVPVLLVFDDLGGPVSETILEEDDGLYETAQGFWTTPDAPIYVVVDWVSTTGFDAAFTARSAPMTTVDIGAVSADETVAGFWELEGKAGRAYAMDLMADTVATVVLEGLARPFVTVVGPLGEVTQADRLDREQLTFVPPVSGTYRVLAVNQSKSDILVELGVRLSVAIELGEVTTDTPLHASGERLRPGRVAPEKAFVRFATAQAAVLEAAFTFSSGMPAYTWYRLAPEGGLTEVRDSTEDMPLMQRHLAEGPATYLVRTDPERLYPENPDIVDWTTTLRAYPVPDVLEAEPNDTSGAATPLPVLPAWVIGEKSNEADVDVYRLDLATPLAANEEVRIEVSAVETDKAVRINILDAMGETINTSSAFGLTRWSILAEDGSGPFFVEVDPAENAPHRYILSAQRQARDVESEPNDTVASATALTFSPGTTAELYGRTDEDTVDFITVVPSEALSIGEAMVVRLRNDAKGSDLELSLVDALGTALKTSKHEDGRLYIRPEGTTPVQLMIEAATSAGEGQHYTFTVDSVFDLEQEPNDSFAQAEPVMIAPGAPVHRIGQGARSANDYYRVDWNTILVADDHIRIDFAGALERGDFQVRSFDGGGGVVDYVRDYRGRILVPPTTVPPLFFNVQPDSFSSNARLDTYELHVAVVAGTVEVEPNDEASDANAFFPPFVVEGQSHEDDPDVFVLAEATVLNVTLASLDEAKAVRVSLRDSSGAILGSAQDSHISWTVDASAAEAPLFLEVRSTLTASAEQSPYQLSVSVP